MKLDQYKSESALKRALKECAKYWDRTIDHPHSNTFGEKILIGLLALAFITTLPYWLSVALIQISYTYLRVKLERIRAGRIIRTKDKSNE